MMKRIRMAPCLTIMLIFSTAAGASSAPAITHVVRRVVAGGVTKTDNFIHRDGQWFSSACTQAKCDAVTDLPESFEFTDIASALGVISGEQQNRNSLGTYDFIPMATSVYLKGVTPPMAGRLVKTSDQGSEQIAVEIWSTQPVSLMPGLTVSRETEKWYFRKDALQDKISFYTDMTNALVDTYSCTVRSINASLQLMNFLSSMRLRAAVP